MKPSEVIMERGWIQNGGSSPAGVCILQAICLALHGDEPCIDTCETSWIPFEEATDDDPIGWNDTPGRTVEQVIALLQEFETEFESDAVQPIDAADFRNALEHMRNI